MLSDGFGHWTSDLVFWCLLLTTLMVYRKQVLDFLAYLTSPPPVVAGSEGAQKVSDMANCFSQ